MYAQYVNSIYTVHNNKYCLPKSTNAGKKKKKGRKRELKNADEQTQSPNAHDTSLYNPPIIFFITSLKYYYFYSFLFIVYLSFFYSSAPQIHHHHKLTTHKPTTHTTPTKIPLPTPQTPPPMNWTTVRPTKNRRCHPLSQPTKPTAHP